MLRLTFVIIFVSIFNQSDGTACPIPAIYQLRLFSIVGGQNTETAMSGTDITMVNKKDTLKGKCLDYGPVSEAARISLENIQVLYQNTSGCYFCFNFNRQSPNIIQYQLTTCLRSTDTSDLTSLRKSTCQTMSSNVITGFSTNHVFFNCKPIIEGIFDFEYVLKDSGICASRNSKIKACQYAGSPLRDNAIFKMRWGYCSSNRESKRNEEITYYCMGQWSDMGGNLWSAVSYDDQDTRFKYRCLMTRMDQQQLSMVQEWGMTIDADCQTMTDIKTAPYRLTLRPGFAESAGSSAKPEEKRIEQLPYMQPTCNLPKNMTGVWFYPGEYNTRVEINATTIKYVRTLNQNKWEEVYFFCKESRENRFLFSLVTKGQCYVDFQCFHFMPRHHNIVRFRQGRPFRMILKEKENRGENYMSFIFNEACHWNSFTLNRLKWRYQYYIMDPPVPVSCPIQGRYKFKQIGQNSEKYITKIPGGVTLRPRVQVICDERKNETDLASCLGNPKHLMLDVARCMTLDYTGRPISEYDVADNILTCVGYWMEDTRSFLITYDPDDPISKNFRCWVYRRVGYHLYRMSRSTSGHCFENQTDESQSAQDGASLMLDLSENEREFDGCPMQFADGHDPYTNVMTLEVFSAAPRSLAAAPIMMAMLFFQVAVFLTL